MTNAILSNTPAALLAGFVLSSVISAVAVLAQTLTPRGAAAAVLVGTMTFGFGGAAVAAAVITFFLTGSILSRTSGARADAARGRAQKGARRDAVQVLANGGAAAACSLGAVLWPAASDAWIAAAFGSLAAAAADTWSTEIGALSKNAPRSIVTGREVPAGTSGAVTPLGFLASLGGGAAIGSVAGAFLPHAPLAIFAASGAVVGLLASAFDSLLGATVQSVWFCSACGEECEAALHRCGREAAKLRGLRFVDNDVVNALATIAGAGLGWCAQAVMR